MIDRVLDFLRRQADAALRSSLGAPPSDSHLVHSRIVGDNGQADIKSTLGMAVIRVEEDRIFPSRTRAQVEGDQVRYIHPEMALTLHVLVAAAPRDDYAGMLRALAELIVWVRANRAFHREQHVELAQIDIERLTIELESLSYEAQNHVWGALGGHYLPSVVLLIRFVPIRPTVVVGVGAPIEAISGVEASP